MKDLVNLQFLKEVSCGNVSFEKEMIEFFFTQTEILFKEVRDGINLQDFKSVAKASHKMKSSLFIVGSHELLTLFDELEKVCSQQDADFSMINLMFENIQPKMSDCCFQLKKYVSKLD